MSGEGTPSEDQFISRLSNVVIISLWIFDVHLACYCNDKETLSFSSPARNVVIVLLLCVLVVQKTDEAKEGESERDTCSKHLREE